MSNQPKGTYFHLHLSTFKTTGSLAVTILNFKAVDLKINCRLAVKQSSNNITTFYYSTRFRSTIAGKIEFSRQINGQLFFRDSSRISSSTLEYDTTCQINQRAPIFIFIFQPSKPQGVSQSLF